MLSDSHWESICTDLLNAWYVQEEGIQWSCKTCLRTGPGATPWHTLRLSLGPAITELRTWMQLNKENLCDSLVLTTPWNASTAPGPPFCPKRKPASSLRAPTTAAPIIVTTSDPPSKGIRGWFTLLSHFNKRDAPSCITGESLHRTYPFVAAHSHHLLLKDSFEFLSWALEAPWSTCLQTCTLPSPRSSEAGFSLFRFVCR
nr:uncharacterized protein LOC105484582 isoform X1 [Macaca nemestrina]